MWRRESVEIYNIEYWIEGKKNYRRKWRLGMIDRCGMVCLGSCENSKNNEGLRKRKERW